MPLASSFPGIACALYAENGLWSHTHRLRLRRKQWRASGMRNSESISSFTIMFASLFPSAEREVCNMRRFSGEGLKMARIEKVVETKERPTTVVQPRRLRGKDRVHEGETVRLWCRWSRKLRHRRPDDNREKLEESSMATVSRHQKQRGFTSVRELSWIDLTCVGSDRWEYGQRMPADVEFVRQQLKCR